MDQAIDRSRSPATPWGVADVAYQIAEGVWEVSTSSHGGVMVHDRVSAFLSDPALRIGEMFGEYITFEEDCAYAAVYADAPALWRAAIASGAVIGDGSGLGSDASDDDIRAAMLRTCHVWYPDEYRVPCQWCAKEGGTCYKHNARRMRPATSTRYPTTRGQSAARTYGLEGGTS